MTDTNTRPVSIRLTSRIDGEETICLYEGRYRYKKSNHIIVYTDYSGNAATRVGIRANEEVMLLHRSGAIKADMLFDIRKDSRVDYDALYVKHHFILHTDCYRLIREDQGLSLYMEYSLDDHTGHPPIRGEQEMVITFLDILTVGNNSDIEKEFL